MEGKLRLYFCAKECFGFYKWQLSDETFEAKHTETVEIQGKRWTRNFPIPKGHKFLEYLAICPNYEGHDKFCKRCERENAREAAEQESAAREMEASRLEEAQREQAQQEEAQQLEEARAIEADAEQMAQPEEARAIEAEAEARQMELEQLERAEQSEESNSEMMEQTTTPLRGVRRSPRN